MIRFVLSPDNDVVPDIKRRLPGRGVWVLAQREIVAKAAAKNAFARGFKAQAKVPDALADEVDKLLSRAALERLSLAAKAGAVTTGFEKVRELLRTGKAGGIIIASDAGTDGQTKVGALAKKAAHLHNNRMLSDVFNSSELELALGRQRVVHVALSESRLSDLFFSEAFRLRTYRLGALVNASDLDQPNERVFAGL